MKGWYEYYEQGELKVQRVQVLQWVVSPEVSDVVRVTPDVYALVVCLEENSGRLFTVHTDSLKLDIGQAFEE